MSFLNDFLVRIKYSHHIIPDALAISTDRPIGRPG